MNRDAATALALEIGQDPSHEWTAHCVWESVGTYEVDAVHRPTQRRHLFHHRDEWLAVQNNQPTKRRRKVKA